MIIIPIKWLFHWKYTLFSDKPICWSSTLFYARPVAMCEVRASTSSLSDLRGSQFLRSPFWIATDPQLGDIARVDLDWDVQIAITLVVIHPFSVTNPNWTSDMRKTNSFRRTTEKCFRRFQVFTLFNVALVQRGGWKITLGYRSNLGTSNH